MCEIRESFELGILCETVKSSNQGRGGARPNGGRKKGSKPTEGSSKPGPKRNFPGVKTKQVWLSVPVQTLEDFSLAVQVIGEEKQEAVILDKLMRDYITYSKII